MWWIEEEEEWFLGKKQCIEETVGWVAGNREVDRRRGRIVTEKERRRGMVVEKERKMVEG
jgi:hypothetical protein